MCSMDSEERNDAEIASDKAEIELLESLDKASIIKKCIDYKTALDELKKESEIFRSLWLKASQQYKDLKASLPDIKESEYNKDWSWVNKIVFVLKKLDRPLLSTEIIAYITPREPVLQHSHTKAQTFSANLTKAVKYGRVKAYKLLGSRGYYYVLSQWLKDDGQLNQEYESKIFFK